jgi:hypothetical protein
MIRTLMVSIESADCREAGQKLGDLKEVTYLKCEVGSEPAKEPHVEDYARCV